MPTSLAGLEADRGANCMFRPTHTAPLTLNYLHKNYKIYAEALWKENWIFIYFYWEISFLDTGMCRITTVRSTTDRIYVWDPLRF
jgi:hypothetical protein